MYKIIKTEENETIQWNDNEVIRFIPIENSNKDYNKYLAWLAEGNEPEIIEI